MIFRKNKIKAKWHKWDRIPETKVIYLNEEKWWNEFIPWVEKMFFNDTTNFWFRLKVKYFLRGWYGWDSNDNNTIWIREKYYTPKTLHHEMGHIIQREHSWKPGIMNPIWIFRWFA